MFEEARNSLIKEGLIKAKQTQVCKPNAVKNPCLYCSTNAICTKPDPFTGELTQLYYPKLNPITEGRNNANLWSSILWYCDWTQPRRDDPILVLLVILYIVKYF